MPCLDEATFLALATGGLPASRAAEVDAHLDACPGCRLLVAEAFQAAEPTSVTATALLSGEPPPPGAPLPRGTAVGRYLVLERLGAGGMGVVYSAYDPELDRRVALKLLRAQVPGLDADAGREHLLREAQAMARVSHPHVVTVHDVGTFGGQVFLAMEYVEAQTLRQWLKAAPRTWRQVRDAFVEAGRGLAAAHAAGLVHGDVKPENLLVGSDGRVRVTDFGLARSLASEGEDAPRHAGGTPAYMAPEQFTGPGRVDARSDQFSFCAALYEGLHGERPFAGGTVEALAAEVRAGRVRPVPRTSSVPAWLQRVVARGLEVDPAARHASMEALLSALQDDPAVRRRRWLGWAGGLVVLVGAVGATHALHSHRAGACEGEGSEALAGIWDDARRRQVESAFLGTGRPFATDAWPRVRRSLDAHASAWAAARGATCQATRVRGEQPEEVMARRMRCLDRRLVELAALTQVLAQADADVVGRAMRAVEALPSPAGCADGAVLAEPDGPSDAASRQREDTLRAAVARGRALGASGRYAEGLAVVERAVAEGGAAGGAEAWLAVAELREGTGNYRGAEAAVFESLKAAEAGRQDEVAARGWTLAVRLSGVRLEQYALAHRWRERAEAAIARLGGDDLLGARLHATVGRILSSQGRHVDAEARYAQAVALLERTVGPESLAVADVLLAWADARAVRGQWNEALELAQRALALRERTLGPEHPEVAQALVALGEVRWYRREYPEAERLAADAVARLERTLGPDHPEVGFALNLMALSWLFQHRKPEEVVALLERALRLVESHVGPDARRTAELYTNLASALANVGRVEEAVRHASEAITRMERTLGPDHPTLVLMYWELGNALQQQGRPAEALPHFERAAALQESLPEDLHGVWPASQLALGRTYLQLERLPEAVATLSRLVAGRPGSVVPHELAVVSRFLLAKALWKSGGDRARALRLVEEARGMVEDGQPGALQLRQDLDAWLVRHGGARR